MASLNVHKAQARAGEFERRAQSRTAHAGAHESRPRVGCEEALSMRLAGPRDRPILDQLAELDCARPLTGPVLLGCIANRPAAALSLADGGVAADPFIPTTELLALMSTRARQLSRARRVSWRSPLGPLWRMLLACSGR